jgi:hypothetical protein
MGTITSKLLATAAAALLGINPALADERLPDGGIARAPGSGPVEAWYGHPTTRYDHGVLGDAIEGGSLVVVDSEGAHYELVLPDAFVFEDVTPRLADLDGDGENEVVTIRTELSKGAAVAVYGLIDGKLVEHASTAPIGQTHRWLSIAAIADFTGDGHQEIAIVKTPHIGGVLSVLSLRDGALRPLYSPQTGYATHFIGSTITSLARTADLDGDGVAELLLPDQSRRHLVALSLAQGVVGLFAKPVPAPIAGQIGISGNTILAPLEDGRTARLSLEK